MFTCFYSKNNQLFQNEKMDEGVGLFLFAGNCSPALIHLFICEQPLVSSTGNQRKP